MKKVLLSFVFAIGMIFSCVGSTLALEVKENKTNSVSISYKEVGKSKTKSKSRQAKYTNVVRGDWIKSGNRWWFKTASGYLADGFYYIDGKEYAFDKDGWMIVGWYKYYYDSETYDWYYFNSNGAMLYKWQHIGGNWYYLDPQSGAMWSDGVYEIDDKLYYLLSDGSMYVGWYKELWDDGTYDWYYFKSDGAMAYDWQLVGGKWYYLEPETGAMYNGGAYSIGKDIYYFLDNGAMLTGWYQEYSEDGTYKWYYFKSDGALAYNWQKVNGTWYYLDSIYGYMHTGWVQYNDNWYYLNANGAMLTGWQKIYGSWYYFDSNGVMASKKWIGNYYVEENGAMAVNKWIGGYFVGPDGCWVQLNAGETIVPVDTGNGNITLVIGTIDKNMSNEIFKQLNQYRSSKGLYTLKNANSQLQEAVNLRGAECVVSFSHTRPNGQSCFSVYENSCAENIAAGKLNATSVMNLWKNSAGHNANMLSTSATSVGIGVFKTRDGYTYCVQLFSWD